MMGMPMLALYTSLSKVTCGLFKLFNFIAASEDSIKCIANDPMCDTFAREATEGLVERW